VSLGLKGSEAALFIHTGRGAGGWLGSIAGDVVLLSRCSVAFLLDLYERNGYLTNQAYKLADIILSRAILERH
jgi:hypothetical protein